MKTNKINFKQQKYILPAIALPFLIFIAYTISSFIGEEDEKPVAKNELSTGLGDSTDSIVGKNDAYDIFFGRRDDRTMLEGLDDEQDSLQYYNDNLTDKQKRIIDSIKIERERQASRAAVERQNYYDRQNDERDYQRSIDMIRMLNEGASGNNSNTGFITSNQYEREEENYDPVKMMRQQMLVMDSLEKSRDPEFQAQLRAEKELIKNEAKLKTFLNSTYSVNRVGLSPHFNSIAAQYETNFIKAVLDETNKGFLGSRIRFRLLEDITVGNNIIPKGSILYGQITGFQMQRVNLSILSILSKGKILPVNLAVYDLDGIKGLYVPESMFRDMMREFGVNSVQGTNLEAANMNFFASMGSKFFTSASQSIANIIQKNKAKLKYNTFIYLIDEKTNQNQNPY